MAKGLQQAATKAGGKDNLVRSVEEWKALVVACMNSTDITKFGREVVKKVGEVSSLDDLNRWIALAMNIWNTTPQPDRGGKTAYEMGDEQRRA